MILDASQNTLGYWQMRGQDSARKSLVVREIRSLDPADPHSNGQPHLAIIVNANTGRLTLSQNDAAELAEILQRFAATASIAIDTYVLPLPTEPITWCGRTDEHGDRYHEAVLPSGERVYVTPVEGGWVGEYHPLGLCTDVYYEAEDAKDVILADVLDELRGKRSELRNDIAALERMFP